MSDQNKFHILKFTQPIQQNQPVLPTPRSDLSNERLVGIKRDSLSNLKSSQPYSSISHRYSKKNKPLSQGTFYGSPLLGQNHLDIIDKMKSQSRNDFYGQLNSIDPYQYPTHLSDLYISPKTLREPILLKFTFLTNQKNLQYNYLILVLICLNIYPEINFIEVFHSNMILNHLLLD
ncbi:unnamed protein product [Paramecium sonneborni]|uniref:Uncharacterized protein n=1 Tax=Paramecium sonneborni TaxID=65129 RepID=A0A8S1RIZ6_9CILI|nr:unnamed protein product [Paramecium sonneborni]